MVPFDPGGVIFSLKNSFTQHDEWSRKSDVIGHSPFLPDVIEGLPSPFSKGTLEETVLRGFKGFLYAKPTLTLSQKPKMLFQNEHFNFLSLGAAKS
jgi:hypothetical protein